MTKKEISTALYLHELLDEADARATRILEEMRGLERLESRIHMAKRGLEALLGQNIDKALARKEQKELINSIAGLYGMGNYEENN